MYDCIDMVRTEYGYKMVYIVSCDGTVLVATQRQLIGSNMLSYDYCREGLNGTIYISKIQCLDQGEGESKKSDSDGPMMYIYLPHSLILIIVR